MNIIARVDAIIQRPACNNVTIPAYRDVFCRARFYETGAIVSISFSVTADEIIRDGLHVNDLIVVPNNAIVKILNDDCGIPVI